MEERIFIHRPALPRVLEQRLDLGSERQPARVNGVIQRLDPDAIADQPELAAAGVPDSDREHSAKPLQERDAPLLKGVDEDLGV